MTLWGTEAGSFQGGDSDVVKITNQTIIDANPAGSAQSRYQLTSSGKAQRARANASGGAFLDIEDWVTPTSHAGDYECRATVTSGSLSSGTAGSWLALTSTQTWGKATTGADDSCDITVEIRRVGTTTVLTSASVHLEADSAP